MKYPLVTDLADEGIPVALTCRVLGAPGSRNAVALSIDRHSRFLESGGCPA